MIKNFFKNIIVKLLGLPTNKFHPMTFIKGNPIIKNNVYIGLFSEINATKGKVIIGDNCDISSFVSINVADSHNKTVGVLDHIERGNIIFENNVFVGSHCFIGGNVKIGHNSAIAAGTILIGKDINIPPYSLVIGNPFKIKKNYFKK